MRRAPRRSAPRPPGATRPSSRAAVPGPAPARSRWPRAPCPAPAALAKRRAGSFSSSRRITAFWCSGAAISPHGRGALSQDRVRDRDGRAAGERQTARQHLVHHDAQRERSLRASTGLPRSCSGDMYVSVPERHPLASQLRSRAAAGRSGHCCLASPKSRTFTSFRGVRMMLPLLTSRCRIPAWARLAQRGGDLAGDGDHLQRWQGALRENLVA